MISRQYHIAILMTALGGALVPLALPAQAVPAAAVTRGKLSFDADATLGDFTGVTTTLTGQLNAADRIASATGWVEAPASSLTTHNDHRDRDMMKSLEVKKYPTIRFELDSVRVGEVAGDSTAVTLLGRFRIHGKTRADSIAGWLRLAAAGATFHGSTPLNVKDYGVGGLSKFLGIFKMSEHIVVHVDVTFGS